VAQRMMGKAQLAICKGLRWRQRPEAACHHKPSRKARLGFAFIYLIFFGILFLGTGVWGRGTDIEELWLNRSNIAGLDDDIDAMVQDKERLYVAGEPQSDDGDEDFFVRALDKETGDEVWQQQFGRTMKNDDSDALAVEGSRVFLVGAIEESEEIGLEDRDILVVAFDSQTGDELWRRELGQPERDDAANSITAHGSRVFVAGMITTDLGDEDLYVTALDAKTGKMLWEYQFDLAGDDDEPSAIAVKKGRVFVAGRARTAAGDEDLFIWALQEETGDFLWQDQFDLAGGNDTANNALVVRGEQVFVAGVSQIGPEDPDDPDAIAPDTDMVVLAWDQETGDLQWQKQFDLEQDDVGSDSPMDIAADDSHVYIAAEGVTARGDTDAVFLALDQETGDLQWQRQFDLEQDDTGDDDGRAIVVKHDRLIVSWRGETARGDRDTVVMILKTSTGGILWQNQFDLNMGDDSLDLLVVDDERIYVAGESATGPEDPDPAAIQPDTDAIVRALEFPE
jgi:outer membrane protein assembly factor BamB